MAGTLWSVKDIEILTSLYAEDTPVVNISSILNRSYKSIYRKAENLGLKHPNTKNKKRTNEQYDKDLKEKCPSIARVENYINSYTKILHKCLVCNTTYSCLPSDKLRGRKCKYCTPHWGINLKTAGIIYLVYFTNLKLYKYGITSKSIEERMSTIGDTEYEIIFHLEFNKGLEAIKLEEKWSKTLKEFKVNTGLLHSGNTETFKYV